MHGGENASQEELHRLLEGLPRIDAGSFERSPLLSATPSTPNTGPLLQSSLSKELCDDASNLPCIDRSLEEIPQVFGDEKSRMGRRHSSRKSKRPVSLCAGNGKGSGSAEFQSGSRETVQDLKAKKQSSVEGC
ncbi:hypothetical protein ACOMHN_017145 [Nucella lapillus]